MENKTRKARAGLLLVGSPRFKNLGADLPRGTYAERKERAVREIIEGLDFLDISFPGIVYERGDAERAIDGFFTEKVDFVIAEFLSWSEDFAWIRFLRDMPQVPVIFVNPVKGRMPFADTLDEDDFTEYLCNGTLVGSLEASGSVARTGRKHLHVTMGSREKVNADIRSFAAAARVRSLLRRANIGLLANPNEAMWSTYMDHYKLFTGIGPEIHYLPYTTYGDIVDGITDDDMRAYRDELLAKYRIMDDVDTVKFEASVRASLGLARIAAQNDIDIMVFNDIDAAMFKRIGLRAGFYHPWFNDNTSILVPEADIGAGLAIFMLKLISGRHVNFIEPFHIESDFGTFAGGHAGPNDHTDPRFAGNVLIARDVRFAKTNYKYAGAPFAWYRIPEGLKTVVQLVECEGSYKMVCFLADSLPGEHILATYSHTIFKPHVPVDELFERILRVGTTQHFAVADGDHRRELAMLAEIMDFEYHEIN